MDITYTIAMIGVGIVMGMYIASQITKSIGKNIRTNKFHKNMNECDTTEVKTPTTK